jgi:opacity protein-like surface antigen
MKKFFIISLLVMFVFASTSVFAAERYALGMSNVALKVDYLNFTDDVFDNIDLDEAIYVGLEGYLAVMPNLYLGMETGWAYSENDDKIGNLNVDIDVTFIPIELNLKYMAEISPQWVLGVGGGISYNYFEIEANDIDRDADDWVFGGQVFAELNYKMNDQWFLGIETKYQWTEDLEFDDFGVNGRDVDTETSADNWRIGARVGFVF